MDKVSDGVSSYAKGVGAEDVAANFLIGNGYEILERRYKTRYGEVDIVALHGAKSKEGDERVLCFIEVKVRRSYEEALLAVTPRSRLRIENAALFYISQEPSHVARDMRFDVIAVARDGDIWHLDNAWQACT
ncbi:MAG: YraN family protein [Alphaproteobacteria bacterium]